MAELVTAKHTEEAGHWYKKDGSPAYTIIGKTGERPTTLRDARKENLVPSVTTIIRCAAAPGLMNWMLDQAIMAALTLPRLMDVDKYESDADYMVRIKADSKEQARKAAERGTLIHAYVQEGFSGVPTDALKEWTLDGAKFFISARDLLLEECGTVKWKTEESFATDRYGGKVDLHSDRHVIDIKTTDKDLATIRTWDEHALQLGAYRHGLEMDFAHCGILYIHVNTAESKLIWISEEDIQKGWKCFNALLDYYYAKTNL